VDLGLRLLLVFHLPAYHHSHYGDNVVAPHGRPNLRSRLHYRHNQEGNHECSEEHVAALGGGTFLYIIQFRQHNIKVKVAATCFDLTSHLQAYLRTIKLITICLCAFGIPDGSQRVLGFPYNLIPMYYCTYVYIGGDVCAASWGRYYRGRGYVRRGFSVFSLFSFRW